MSAINFDTSSVVPNPSPLTTSYLQSWFLSTPSCIDSALKILNLPPASSNSLISKTKSLLVQSQWIAKPQNVLFQAKNSLAVLAQPLITSTLSETEKHLQNTIWPHVIAIDMLTEYFHQVVMSEKNGQEIITQTTQAIRDQDWMYQSIIDMPRLGIEDYLAKYGNRADIDYEITCPRWHEIPTEIQKRQLSSQPYPTNTISLPNHRLAHLLGELLIARSQARKYCLNHINTLRIQLNFPTGDTQITNSSPASKSFGVSPGIISGTTLKITTNSVLIPPNTIGIFPNSSPEFTTQFPKCIGIIFLQGGATSHGAIVAREFGIPAITAPALANTLDKTKLSIDGTKGTYTVVQ